MAGQGVGAAVAGDPALAKGVNIYRGHVTHEAVARDLNYPCQPLSKVLKMS
jgi:alanine dehydrogenase